jgi:hypothetical protein
MALNRGPRIVTNGLTLCLDAANRNSYPGSGTIWRDLSGNNNNGTLTNGPAFNPSNGGNILFDGTNDYVSFTSTTVGSFNNSTFSFGLWFYFNGLSQVKTLFSKRNDHPFNQYNMGISDDIQNGTSGTKLGVFLNPDGGDSTLWNNLNYSLPYTGWHYGMCVVNTTVQTMYLNGVSVVTGNKNYAGYTFNIVDKPLYVAATNSNNNPTNFFGSNIAVVYLYSRSLTASEVLQNFNANRRRFGI